MKGALPLAEATTIALSIRQTLLEAVESCSRVEIAGSIRRCKPVVGDIELVAQIDPAMEFGATVGIKDALRSIGVRRADPIVRKDGVAVKAPWGDRYLRGLCQYIGPIQLDLFVVRPPAEFGPVFLIRTGAAAFSQMMVTRLHRYNMVCSEGRILRRDPNGDVDVPCPTEEEFFRLVRLPVIPPELREPEFPETAALLAGETVP